MNIKKLNTRITNYIDRTFYPNHSERWDDQLFRSEILKYIQPDSIILDVGAGRGRVPEMNFRGIAHKVFGIDPDPRVRDNPLLDESHQGVADHMPFFSDEAFDLVISDNVLEHVQAPEPFYREISRVLKTGGYFISKTPNRYCYVALLAAISPTSFHRFINQARGREDSDTFPTFYRCNTKRAQENWARRANLQLCHVTMAEGRPEYVRLLFPAYAAGTLWERGINYLNASSLKTVMMSVMRKL